MEFLHLDTGGQADGKLVVPGLKNKVTSAKLLAGGKKLEANTSGERLVIQVPAKAPDKISSTLALQIEGAVMASSP